MARILHVIATLDRGGTEVSCRELAREFAARGEENHVVALVRHGGAIAGAFAGVAHEHGTLPAGRLRRAVAFARLCRRLRPDGAIFHFFTVDHAVLAAAARLAGVRRLAVKQGNPAPAAGPLVAKVKTILAATRRLGVPLVSSSRFIEETMRALGALPAGSAVVHNGADVSAIAARAAAARVARDPAGPVVVGMVARLDPIKDYATLLAAFAALPEAIGGRPLVLAIVGDGALRGALEAKAAALGVAGRVRFRGARADVPAELGGMDLFVLSTTRDEGFGVVLVEALAAGVPVIASDVPACREVLSGGLGTLVPAADPGSLGAAVAAALAAPPAAPDAATVAARYGTGPMADGYAAVLFGRRP